jgi:hypothetical protein
MMSACGQTDTLDTQASPAVGVADACYIEADYLIDPTADLPGTPDEAIKIARGDADLKADAAATNRTRAGSPVQSRGEPERASLYRAIREERSAHPNQRFWVARNARGEVLAEVTVERIGDGWAVTRERWVAGTPPCER